eukprot:scaffold65583_cov33-Phaeocystis_antarctica.AAC.1
MSPQASRSSIDGYLGDCARAINEAHAVLEGEHVGAVHGRGEERRLQGVESHAGLRTRKRRMSSGEGWRGGGWRAGQAHLLKLEGAQHGGGEAR